MVVSEQQELVARSFRAHIDRRLFGQRALVLRDSCFPPKVDLPVANTTLIVNDEAQ